MSEKLQEWIEAVERAAEFSEAEVRQLTAVIDDIGDSAGRAELLDDLTTLSGDYLRLTELAAYLRDGGAELERLRAAANAAFDLLGGIDGAAGARDLLLAGLMPAALATPGGEE